MADLSITPPSDPTNVLKCRDAVVPRFDALLDAMVRAGWSQQTVALAIVALGHRRLLEVADVPETVVVNAEPGDVGPVS